MLCLAGAIPVGRQMIANAQLKAGFWDKPRRARRSRLAPRRPCPTGDGIMGPMPSPSVRNPQRLLVLDVEGTLFDAGIRLPGTTLASTIWQAIAVALGPVAVEEEVATHHRWSRGEYPSYLAWMKDTIEI